MLCHFTLLYLEGAWKPNCKSWPNLKCANQAKNSSSKLMQIGQMGFKSYY